MHVSEVKQTHADYLRTVPSCFIGGEEDFASPLLPARSFLGFPGLLGFPGSLCFRGGGGGGRFRRRPAKPMGSPRVGSIPPARGFLGLVGCPGLLGCLCFRALPGMKPPVGIEPTTVRLRSACSAN